MKHVLRYAWKFERCSADLSKKNIIKISPVKN